MLKNKKKFEEVVSCKMLFPRKKRGKEDHKIGTIFMPQDIFYVGSGFVYLHTNKRNTKKTHIWMLALE